MTRLEEIRLRWDHDNFIGMRFADKHGRDDVRYLLRRLETAEAVVAPIRELDRLVRKLGWPTVSGAYAGEWIRILTEATVALAALDSGDGRGE